MQSKQRKTTYKNKEKQQEQIETFITDKKRRKQNEDFGFKICTGIYKNGK